MKKITIVLSSDHGGFDLKEAFKKYLQEHNYEVKDLGAFSKEKPSSYACQGQVLAKEIQKNDQKELGIGFCGTGIGISIAVNRFHNIRGARITNLQDAELAKKHNNANILLFGGRETEPKKAFAMFEKFMETQFEGDRHIARIEQLEKNEN